MVTVQSVQPFMRLNIIEVFKFSSISQLQFNYFGQISIPPDHIEFVSNISLSIFVEQLFESECSVPISPPTEIVF